MYISSDKYDCGAVTEPLTVNPGISNPTPNETSYSTSKYPQADNLTSVVG